MARKTDPEMAEFEAAVLRSIDQAQRGEYAAVHAPAEIRARKRGRPTDSVKANPKVATNIRLSPDVLAYFRATGEGWQSRIDGALKDYVARHAKG
jgi:uncharacterized protein (DUF4415 family)